jgi:thiosulfate/3-mercaptopyruvate sulfurtransferase
MFALMLMAATAAITACGKSARGPDENAVEKGAELPQLPEDFDFGAGTKPILLSVGQLKERMSGVQRGVPDFLAIVDVRPRSVYELGHIPKAVHVDADEWQQSSIAPGGLQDAEAWSERIGKLGINRVTYVVVYGDQPQNAARVWWTLKYLGVANAAILDGGWKHWLAARGDVTAHIPPSGDTRPPVLFQRERLAEIADLKRTHKSPNIKVIDARSQEEFEKGRIPGAVHIEWKELLAPDGRFKSAKVLKTLFREHGINDSKTMVTYCLGDGRSALDAFALELAGLPKVKYYYSNWQEWSADSEAPVEK